MNRAFFDRPVLDVAADLVGCVVRHGETAGMIVEAEAYHDSEPACHAHVGLTPRTATLFGAPGRAYVYRSYGIHAMLNAVTGPAWPLSSIAPFSSPSLDRVEDLCSGPGKLTQALGIGLDLNATDLLSGPIRFEPRGRAWHDRVVATAPRVGITKAVELPWRFTAASSRFVSRPRPGSATSRARAA